MTYFFCSDCWWVEGDTAWFVSAEYNILFQLNMNTGRYDFLAELPNNDQSKFRRNPKCIKIGNSIFCMPNFGSHILVYDLCSRNFEQISLINPEKRRILITGFVEYENKLYIASCGLNAVIEINIQEKKVNHYYSLPEIMLESSRYGVRVGDSLYIVSTKTNHVCQFDFETKKIIMHEIPNVSGGIYTICYDGVRFWLSGLRKEIYVWNKENNDVRVLKDFPEDFGIYCFGKTEGPLLDCETDVFDTAVFLGSVFVGGEAWFIPWYANKIIYVDKETLQMKAFEIDGEEETESSLEKRRFYSKYILMCVIQERYIILYSIKRGIYIKIDTVNKTMTEEEIYPSHSCIAGLIQMQSKYISYEQDELSVYLYQKQLFATYAHNATFKNIGAEIYNTLCSSD